MAKIHPQTSVKGSDHSTSERETFTIWMKSLVFHGNGCTVFNSKGEVVFRVDNYQTRRSSEVFLMDFNGEVLFSMKRKILRIFESWEGYKWIDSKLNKERSWFQVRSNCSIFRRRKHKTCHVSLGCDKNTPRSSYQITGLEGKSTFKIIDNAGHLVAQVIKKQSLSGVPLGDDVFTLIVEPQMDHSLVMALVTVHGLINQKL
ncbi:protein LURP-one-related 11-like [Olea europaea var. sylvestris]|uniref:LURP-one-related 11-like n=1 Tax=Olea europaea subsp. europaea TaxID=158383 RepID=A0A8S0QHB3_OLEEU|nr:protein LURP-one-related 11-like [Olea europaea var. sylvestris]CAA2966691.1 LURP-one-related 11-like [Olea europaea subsp. europaea]